MHTDECRVRMEAKIREFPRGAIRMQDYERKLAAEVEDRVLRENKAAKTQSAHEPNLDPTSTNSQAQMSNSKPANNNEARSHSSKRSSMQARS